MSIYVCVCGHVVEYHDVTTDDDDDPGTWTCHGNAANRRPPKTCPCDGWEQAQ